MTLYTVSQVARRTGISAHVAPLGGEGVAYARAALMACACATIKLIAD